MPDQPNDLLTRHFPENGADLMQQVEAQLNLIAPSSPNISLYRDMILTVLRMAQDDRDRWNAKITLKAINELDHAFRVLEQFKSRRKVTVFGSARTPVESPLYALAREVGAALARSDLMVITGGGGGIMAAAHEGAGLAHSLGFNITLPFEQHANPTIDGTENLLSFHFFFTRKLFFVKEADALVLCPGGFGTLDEALEVLTLIQTGKSPLVPVVLLDEPGGGFWQGALDFIRSQLEANRYILPTDLKLVRLNHPLSERALAHIQTAFADLRLSDDFQQLAYGGEEHDEAHFSHLTRLVFNFTGRNQGRLRELVDYINLPENWAQAQGKTQQRVAPEPA